MRVAYIAVLLFVLVAAELLAVQFLASNLQPNLPTANIASRTSDIEKRISTYNAQVARVIDGDTIVLENGERVRYIGIDAPEVVHPKRPIECFGRESTNRNRQLVEGKMVRLEKDVSERDKYNRLLRYVWSGEDFVNLKLVQEGYASVFTYPPDVKYAAEFVKAEREARAAERGLWSTCENL